MTDQQHIPASKLLYEVNEVAEMLSLGRSTLYALILSGSLKSVKIGRRRLVAPEAIHDFVVQLQDDGYREG